RRLKDKEARRKVLLCLQGWKTAYLAYPETGAPFLQRMIQELIGTRLLEWLRFQPAQLGTIEESRSLGFNALAALKELMELPSGMPAEEVFKMLAYTIFHRHILPTFAGVTAGDEAAREPTISLLLQALHLFRDLYPAPEYLDFVFAEITEEQKFRWVDVSGTGDWQPVPYESELSFDPTDILEQLSLSLPQRFKLLDARQRIARRRFADLQNRYFREVSEYTHENRQIERHITIEILRKLKGLFLFYPDAAFLELPIRELEGNGRIRWREQFLGVFPSRSNHYENQYFQFDYQQELSEFRMYRDTRLQWMEHVLRQTGDLPEP
ncbi:MAG: hypothetical protein IT260_21410, partial [Saprospiraceae bacterium]|nr:hypothetical protein [Saprospiraceae bacterium]